MSRLVDWSVGWLPNGYLLVGLVVDWSVGSVCRFVRSFVDRRSVGSPVVGSLVG